MCGCVVCGGGGMTGRGLGSSCRTNTIRTLLLFRLLQNTDAHLIPSSQELKLAEEIRRGKEKQLRQQKDIKDAIRKWESLYGHWVSHVTLYMLLAKKVFQRIFK